METKLGTLGTLGTFWGLFWGRFGDSKSQFGDVLGKMALFAYFLTSRLGTFWGLLGAIQ